MLACDFFFTVEVKQQGSDREIVSETQATDATDSQTKGLQK